MKTYEFNYDTMSGAQVEQLQQELLNDYRLDTYLNDYFLKSLVKQSKQGRHCSYR